jgi:4a-hydroxytetrahydrobiopterin dehydratase
MEKLANLQLMTDRQLLDTVSRNRLLTELPLWKINRVDGVDQLVRVFRWKDFSEALAFANDIAELAEKNNHHPALLVEWGKTTVSWWTHSLGGLHQNDFVMAARCDVLYDQYTTNNA